VVRAAAPVRRDIFLFYRKSNILCPVCPLRCKHRDYRRYPKNKGGAAVRKAIFAGLSALALIAALPAYAQQPAASSHARTWHPTAAQSAALTEANIAALKTALNLTPDQAKNWPAFEGAIRDLAKKRADRLSAIQQSERKPETHFDRVRQRAATLTKIAAGLNEYADAATPLFQSLDASQKQLFILLTTKWARP